MSHSSLRLQCANPDCLYLDNAVDQTVCDRCQAPLVHRYLWAVNAAETAVDTLVNNRYLVIRPQVWLDTQPGQTADVPALLPDRVLPYLHLYLHRLHIPGFYGFCSSEDATKTLLLENAPIDPDGQMHPLLEAVWKTAAPARQVYWLWQLFQLWQPLKTQGVATSLLKPDNIHTEGWRVRLRQLIFDQPQLASEIGSETGSETRPPDSEMITVEPETERDRPLPTKSPLLKELGSLWLTWLDQTQAEISEPLRTICQTLQTIEETEVGLETISTQLNRLLLEQTAQLPLYLETTGATTTGPQRAHNEDACFPTQTSSPDDPLLPYVGIICDGIGGHEGGEVASQMALRSLQLQIRALLADVLKQDELDPPELLAPQIVQQQIREMVRVVNNLIATQNDTQGRELRQRMGTTLVMALQLPQTVATPNGQRNAHELYLAHVGDSRAYWLTSTYCHPLTVDDDVVTREVVMGRSPYQEALQRPDGGALTQALGTRNADLLAITVQRFVLEEEGILLLCSDGLSDYDRIEQSWEPIAQYVLTGDLSLPDAVQAWIQLANQQNGHDNTSVVLMHHHLSDRAPARPTSEPLAESDLSEPQLPDTKALPAADADLTESSRALLYDNDVPLEPSVEKRRAATASSWKPVATSVKLLGLVMLMFTIGMLGVAIWQQFDPNSFWRLWGQEPPSTSPASPSQPSLQSPSLSGEDR